MFTPSEFIECLGKISIAKSVKGHLYKDLKLIGNRIDGIRCDTKKHFKLSIEELYCAYEKGVSTTTEMRNFLYLNTYLFYKGKKKKYCRIVPPFLETDFK